MNVEIKKGLIIFHDPWDWESISEKIIEEYGASMMISWNLVSLYVITKGLFLIAATMK